MPANWYVLSYKGSEVLDALEEKIDADVYISDKQYYHFVVLRMAHDGVSMNNVLTLATRMTETDAVANIKREISKAVLRGEIVPMTPNDYSELSYQQDKFTPNVTSGGLDFTVDEPASSYQFRRQRAWRMYEDDPYVD